MRETIGDHRRSSALRLTPSANNGDDKRRSFVSRRKPDNEEADKTGREKERASGRTDDGKTEAVACETAPGFAIGSA